MTEVMLKAGTEFVPVNEAVRLIAEALCPVTKEETAIFVGLPNSGKEPNEGEKREGTSTRLARINVMNAHYHRMVGLINSGELSAISHKTRIPTRTVNNNTVLTTDEYEGYLKGLGIVIKFLSEQKKSERKAGTDLAAMATGSYTPDVWIAWARQIALAYIQKHTAMNLYPSQDDVSSHVESQFGQSDVRGAYNNPITASNIRRSAFTADGWWSRNRRSGNLEKVET